MIFRNRTEAGRRLAERLGYLRGQEVVVVGLPRGGIPVAYEVAQALGAPLDVILVRKLGVPFQPELAMGAIAEGGVRVLNDRVLRLTGIDPGELSAVEGREREELDRRAHRFRGSRPRVPLAGRVVIVIDDGVATGSTASAACQVIRASGAARVILATPVAPPPAVEQLRRDADEVVCLDSPEMFTAIGQFYDDFSQTPDSEVVDLLRRAEVRAPASSGPPAGMTGEPARAAEVEIPVGAVYLPGTLTVPSGARGVVVFAHGSGSSRHSPRNRFVADTLNTGGFATLLFDLLTPAEEIDRANVFDIALLAHRLSDVTQWLRGQPETSGLPVGYFGASTGAGAALRAAAEPGSRIAAVVSRGGRPDLVDAARLAAVRAPTLLIVGGDDDLVLELNNQARAQMRCDSQVAVVPGATHLFPEPGALETVADLARGWFSRHLVDLVAARHGS